LACHQSRLVRQHHITEDGGKRRASRFSQNTVSAPVAGSQEKRADMARFLVVDHMAIL
jgi:hypothetical protein